MAFKLTSRFCTLTCITAEVFTVTLRPLILCKTSSFGVTMTFETNSGQFSGADLRNSGSLCQSLLTLNSDALGPLVPKSAGFIFVLQ